MEKSTKFKCSQRSLKSISLVGTQEGTKQINHLEASEMGCGKEAAHGDRLIFLCELSCGYWVSSYWDGDQSGPGSRPEKRKWNFQIRGFDCVTVRRIFDWISFSSVLLLHLLLSIRLLFWTKFGMIANLWATSHSFNLFTTSVANRRINLVVMNVFICIFIWYIWCKKFLKISSFGSNLISLLKFKMILRLI